MFFNLLRSFAHRDMHDPSSVALATSRVATDALFEDLLEKVGKETGLL